MSTAWGFYRPIEPTCRTGDCEWPTFTSLGLCSKCTNVTDTTARNCFVDNIPSEADGSMSSNRGNLSTTCEFISSNGGVVTFRSTELILPGPNGTSHIARIYPTILSNTTVRSHNLSTYAGIKDPMFGYIGVHLIPTVLSTQPRDPLTLNNSYDAQECAIYYCEKSYQSSETKDGLAVSSANVLSSQPLYALYPINQIDQNSTQWYGNQPTEEKVTSKYSVQSSLSFQFAGTLDKIFFVNMDDFGVSPVYMHLVGTNLLEMMENATSSITDSMRIYSLDSTTVEGKIHGKETYVRVTWSWLLLPAIIQFGGTVVLIWTMVTASQQNTVLWKSSVLALLLREVSIYDQDENNSERKNINILEMSGAKRVSEMDRLSEQYTVRLEPDDETTFMFKGHGIGSS